jgi:hypothetical protein
MIGHAQLQAKQDATARRAAHFGEMVRVRMLRLRARGNFLRVGFESHEAQSIRRTRTWWPRSLLPSANASSSPVPCITLNGSTAIDGLSAKPLRRCPAGPGIEMGGEVGLAAIDDFADEIKRHRLPRHVRLRVDARFGERDLEGHRRQMRREQLQSTSRSRCRSTTRGRLRPF